MTKEELLEECQGIVEETCEKYGYDREDIEGNDSLRTVLLKAVPAMLEDSSKEDRELFYQMLRNTPIVVTENLTEQGLAELEKKYIGAINPHIIEEKQDKTREYGKGIALGAFTAEPIINEKMQVVGKKSFIYIPKVEGKAKEFFGTDIHVADLQHELGHAWNAEDKQFTIEEQGILTNRVGAVKYKYSLSQSQEDGKTVMKFEGVTGIYMEEAMNTIEEEKAVMRYLGISQEELKDAYNNQILERNAYQTNVTDQVKHLLKETSEVDLKKWRRHGDEKGKEEVENLIGKTKAWEQLRNGEPINENFNNEKKRNQIESLTNPKAQEFFEKHHKVYFPDVSQMTPMEKLDNVLEQSFNLNAIIQHISPDNCALLCQQINSEYYILVNQAADIKAKEQIAKCVGDVKLSDVEEVTKETKEGVKSLRIGEKVQEEKE